MAEDGRYGSVKAHPALGYRPIKGAPGWSPVFFTLSEPGGHVFAFADAAGAGTGALRDRITDFAAGIDNLSLVFMASFIGAAAFSGTVGQVRYAQATGLLQGDVNGDTVVDFELLIVNSAVLTAADFSL